MNCSRNQTAGNEGASGRVCRVTSCMFLFNIMIIPSSRGLSNGITSSARLLSALAKKEKMRCCFFLGELEPASRKTSVFGVESKCLRHLPPADLPPFNVKLLLVSGRVFLPFHAHSVLCGL